MRKWLIILIVFVSAFRALAETELNGTPGELREYLSNIPRSVSVMGESELKVQADRAYVKLKITTEKKYLQDTLKENSSICSAITEELKKKGVPADSILGSRFSSTPRHGIFSDKVKSYKVENIIRVAVKNEDELESVAGTIDAHEESSYEGIDFENANESELKQQVLAQACDVATQKKQLYEDRLGLKLTPVGFTEGTTMKEPSLREIDYSRAKQSGLAFTQKSEYDSMIEGGTRFDEIRYKSQVIVQYRIENP